MSVDIVVSWDHPTEEGFYVGSGVYDSLCETVGNYARMRGHGQSGYDEVVELCQAGKEDSRLLLVDASMEARAVFRDLLREALNDGTIMRKLVEMPPPRYDAYDLLPENRIPEVRSLIRNSNAIQTFVRLTIYLDRCLEADP